MPHKEVSHYKDVLYLLKAYTGLYKFHTFSKCILFRIGTVYNTNKQNELHKALEPIYNYITFKSIKGEHAEHIHLFTYIWYK